MTGAPGAGLAVDPELLGAAADRAESAAAVLAGAAGRAGAALESAAALPGACPGFASAAAVAAAASASTRSAATAADSLSGYGDALRSCAASHRRGDTGSAARFRGAGGG